MSNTQILNGKEVAEFAYNETVSKIEQLKKNSITPGLAVVLVGDDPASAVYVRSKGKMCERMGINSKTITMAADSSQEELLQVIDALNNDDAFHGILVQLPLPKHMDEQKVIEAIKPQKDVDCFHPHNVGLLTIGQPYLWPCTPAGIIEIFKYYKIDTNGKNVVVIGRSNIVGKPIANMLIQKDTFANATVTVVHSRTKELASFTKNADIIIAAMGVPLFLKEEMVKNDAVIIDVGINRVESAESKKGYKLVGDVDYAGLFEKSAAITPVPGGVGPMTIGMLMRNTVIAAAKINNLTLK